MTDPEFYFDETGSILGDRRREQNRCAQLLYILNRLEGMYKISTGRNFRSLRRIYHATDGGLIAGAIRKIKDAGIVPYDAGDINPHRSWREMTLADIEVFDSCLRYSAKDELLLIRYDEASLWSCKALSTMPDFWEAYGGLFQECRSTIVNIDLMEYALLPFAKFRNLNESAEYSLEAVKRRIEKAGIVEFSEKLDGSMIQMRYIGEDPRFWHGIVMSTSGSLYPDKAPQLKHVIEYMDNNGASVEALVKAYPHDTFIFEWIDSRDEHMVRYKPDQYGLHLIGARFYSSGWQWDYHRVIQAAEKYRIPSTRLFSYSIDDALASLEKMSGAEQEGYVLNVDGFLVKIKCPDFLNLMRAANVSSSFNTIVRYAADGSVDDFISMLPPAYQDAAKEKLRKIRQFEADVLSDIETRCSQLPDDRKTAMLMIDALPVDSAIKGLLKAKYLGRPIEIIARHKGNSVQYVRESEIDSYYESRKSEQLPAFPEG